MAVEERTLVVSPESERALRAFADRVREPVDDLLSVAIARYIEEEELHLSKITAAMARAGFGEALVPFDDAVRGWRESIETVARRRA